MNLKNTFSTGLVSWGLLLCAFSATAQLNVQWDKTLGGSSNDHLYSTILTPDGGYLLAGESLSNASGDKSEDNNGVCNEEGDCTPDYWIIQIDKHGQKQWDKTFGGSAGDYFSNAILTSDGGYLLAGSSLSDASGDKSEDSKGRNDYWIIKIDVYGQKQWDKTFGGSSLDGLSDVISTPDGGYLLAGSSHSDASGDKTENSKGEWDYWIIKIDAEGNKQWDKTFGGSAGDLLASAILTSDGGYLLAGSSFSDASGDKSENRRGSCNEEGYCPPDYWVIKINAQGIKQWDKTFGGENDDNLVRVIATSDGSYLLAGSSFSDASTDKTENSKGEWDYWIIRIDAEGNKQWDKTFGGSAGDLLASAIPISEGGYLLAGSSLSDASGDKTEDGKGEYDYWIAAIDKYGQKLWDKTLGGSSSDQLYSTIPTSHGDYLLSGLSYSNASGDKTEDSKGGSDYWIVKIVETKEAFSVRNFSLVNADSDQVLFSLQNKEMINLSDIGNPLLTVRANTTPINVDSVKLELTGPISHTQTERYYPYALFGDDPKAGGGRDFIGKAWKAGEYRLTATPFIYGRAGNAHEVSFSVIDDVSAAVSYFVLVNADTDQDINRLSEGDIIDLSALGQPSLSIRAIPDPIKVDRIELILSGPLSHAQTEHYWPYALFGDDPDGPRDYTGREWPEGNYTLTATPYVNNKKGATATISFSVTGSNSNARMAAYPVPTTGVININYEGPSEQVQLMLLDFTGQPLLSLPLKEETQLDLSAYRKGIYYLKVVDQQGVHLKRVVVE